MHGKGFALYGKGFALYSYCSKESSLCPAQNEVKNRPVEGVAAGIDRKDVPRGQRWPCRGPGAGGGVWGAPEPPRRTCRLNMGNSQNSLK